MSSFAEQFLRAGLVSKEKHEAIEKEKEEYDKQKSGELIHQASKKSGRPVGFVRLESCGTIAEFKDTARKLLQQFPEEITDFEDKRVRSPSPANAGRQAAAIRQFRFRFLDL